MDFLATMPPFLLRRVYGGLGLGPAPPRTGPAAAVIGPSIPRPIPLKLPLGTPLRGLAGFLTIPAAAAAAGAGLGPAPLLREDIDSIALAKPAGPTPDGGTGGEGLLEVVPPPTAIFFVFVGFFILFPFSWEPIWARDMAMSAIPSPQAFVDARVGIALCLLTGELLLHARHSGTKALAPTSIGFRLWIWCRGLEVHPLPLGRRTAFGVQPTFGVFAFLAGPCRGFGHYSTFFENRSIMRSSL